MRVYLDTNVLVSAFTTRGICADIFALVLSEHQLVLGEAVLEELSRVLKNKMRMPEAAVRDADALLRREAVVVSGGVALPVEVRDPDDVAILSEAALGLTETLVTGDRDLLVVAGEVEFAILTPREFWTTVRGAP